MPAEPCRLRYYSPRSAGLTIGEQRASHWRQDGHGPSFRPVGRTVRQAQQVRSRHCFESVQYPLDIGEILFMEFLQHAKAIFRFGGFGAGREECRYDGSLAVNLVLAEFGPSFGRLKSSYPKGGYHLTTLPRLLRSWDRHTPLPGSKCRTISAR